MQRYGRLFSVMMVLSMTAAMPAHALTVDMQLSSDESLPNDVAIFTPPPVAIAPPPLPVYDIPPPPYEEYAWMPGHWRWDGYEYFWVPGTWVRPPVENVVWTPGYWDWDGYAYEWHEGYWAETVGYYGGIYYGGGYDGARFYGGGWVRGHYEHNPAIFYERNARRNYISFHGGPGGIMASATAQQRFAEHERHFELTHEQREHMQVAEQNPSFRTSNNHGRPAVAATVAAGDFAHNVVGAERAGPKNVAATEHNAEVRQNPALAHDAALPQHWQQQPAAVAPMGRTARPAQTEAMPAARVVNPTVVANPTSRVASPMMVVEPSHANVEPVTPQPETARPQHMYQPREPAVAVSRPAFVQPVQEEPRARSMQAAPTPPAAQGSTRQAPQEHQQAPQGHPQEHRQESHQDDQRHGTSGDNH